MCLPKTRVRPNLSTALSGNYLQMFSVEVVLDCGGPKAATGVLLSRGAEVHRGGPGKPGPTPERCPCQPPTASRPWKPQGARQGPGQPLGGARPHNTWISDVCPPEPCGRRCLWFRLPRCAQQPRGLTGHRGLSQASCKRVLSLSPKVLPWSLPSWASAGFWECSQVDLGVHLLLHLKMGLTKLRG